MKSILFIAAALCLALFISSCAMQELSAPKPNITAVSNDTQTVQASAENNTRIKPIIPSNLTTEDLSVKQNATTEQIVKIIDVTDSGDACILEINGTRDVINVGSEDTIDGITVHVFDVKVVHSQLASNDLCNILISMKNAAK